MQSRNLFSPLPEYPGEEEFRTLLRGEGFELERIVSFGQGTPPGEWYDQEFHEWVVLLAGSAGLLFDGESTVHVLVPGDYVNIPAHQRHRVEWTDDKGPTVWLALHYR